jgi:hypothetical protein
MSINPTLAGRARTAPSATTIFIGGLVLVAGYVTALMWAMTRSDYDLTGAMLIVPLLVASLLPLISRQAARESDRAVFSFLLLALGLRFVGAVARYVVAFAVYGGVADAGVYHDAGVRISAAFRAGDFTTGLQSLTGTNFLRFATGVLYTVIGPTKLGGFFCFAALAFVGSFFFYRAFTIAIPDGYKKTYARFIFLLPSFVFWPSSIGKEAWMTFTLGLCALAAARILSGNMRRGIFLLITGLWLAGMVRPHMAGVVVLSVGAAYVLKPAPVKWREVAFVAKASGIAVIAVIALLAVTRAESFLREAQISTDAGLSGALQGVTSRTNEGGSGFDPYHIWSPAEAPLAAATVLFRPLPTDAHNLQAQLAAIEGVFLLFFSAWRLPRLWAAGRTMRHLPYIGYAASFVALSIVGYSGVANFGLLVRERTQFLPLYVALLCIPSLRHTPAEAVRTRDAQMAITR